LRQAGAPADLEAARMGEPTALLPLSEAAIRFAAPSFVRGRDWLGALRELMHRIHADFEFEPGATTVSTSVDEVLLHKRGVCQDFAHLMLAALRGHGLAARYVSGYLLTDPPSGQPRLMGVDASHAWVAAWSPEHGWVEFDPTNDQLADQRYITLAWGADFADVVPLRGVILGGGAQTMHVSVSVLPVGS
jgi:transglutaminase-like putative cysteine protease